MEWNVGICMRGIKENRYNMDSTLFEANEGIWCHIEENFDSKFQKTLIEIEHGGTFYVFKLTTCRYYLCMISYV